MRNEYIVDWPLLKKWTKEAHFTGIRLIFFIGWCVFLAVTLYFCISSIINNSHTTALYFGLMAVFCFFRAFLRNTIIAKQQYKKLAQIHDKNSWLRTISFKDDKIIVKEEKFETKYNYCDILEIIEKDEIIYLKFKANLIVKLYKSKFIDCTWEECKERITANTPHIN